MLVRKEPGALHLYLADWLRVTRVGACGLIVLGKVRLLWFGRNVRLTWGLRAARP
jgi:hypothetical protein